MDKIKLNTMKKQSKIFAEVNSLSLSTMKIVKTKAI